MLKNILNGFSMALADSVPGVSGGTIAFIMGFYDEFIGSINKLAFGDKDQKKEGFLYLLKLGVGWVAGMILAVFILSSIFERHIYKISSLFIGFELGALPIIVKEETASLKKKPSAILFLLLGMLFVIAITFINTRKGTYSINLADLSPSLALRLFLIGSFAISAMVLPGISGSTILLIFGAYIPIISGLKDIFSLNFDPLASIIVFGLGVIVGGLFIVRIIRYCLRNYRAQAIYTVLGMMIGALYAIVMGPTGINPPQAPLSLENFSILAFVGGILILFGMQFLKDRTSDK
ncbi:MAG: DUF368 domain-containing protein [Finegoldia sp.]|nr:DUF368 domain-containing protein [Finegoldia sp.]